MADVLTVEPSARRSWLGPGAGRRAGVALAAGAVGLGGFVGSLMLDWVRSSLELTIPSDGGFGVEADTITIPERSLGLLSSPFDVAYQVGVVGLLAVLAAVLARPELAARLRLAAAALGLGVGALVVASVMSLRGVPGDVVPFQLSSADHSYEPGLFCAVGGVVALVAGVWLAAAPARGAAPGEVAVPAAPRPPSALARLVGSQAPAVAFFAGVVGVGGFVASLLVSWLQVRGTGDASEGLLFGDQILTLGIGDVTTSTVYQLGVLSLVAALGAAAARPALAARVRAGTVGIGLGLAAVLVTAILEERGWLAQTFGRQVLFVVNGSDLDELFASLEITRQPGGYIALATVVVLTAGVWAAGAGLPGTAAVPSPAVVAASYPAVPAQIPAGYVLVPVHAMPAAPAPTGPDPAAPAPNGPAPEEGLAGTPAALAANPYAPPQVSGPAANWSRPVGYADGLSVSTSESVDIGTQSDILRN